MYAGLDDAVGPALEGIADVDDHLRRSVAAPGEHRRKCPWLAAVLELKSADRVLEEQSDDAEIGVRPGSLDLALGELLQVSLGVVVQAQFAGGRDAALDEGVLGDAQPDFHDAHEGDADFLELEEAALHEALEAG